MDRLPPELLQKIAKSLPRQELFNVRLVNHSLASASAPFLFAVIPLWLGLKSLESLNNVSEHPQLSQYVKTIACSTLHFIDHKPDRPAPESHIRNWLELGTDSSSVHALGVERYMSAYNRFIGNQRNFTKNRLDVKILARAIRRLRKLKSVEVDWNNLYMGSDEIIRAFGMFKAEPLISFDGVHFMPVLFQALAASGIRLRRLHLGRGEHFGHQQNIRNLSDIVQPLLPRQEPPTFNNFDSSLTGTLAPQALAPLFENPNTRTVAKVLSSLYEFTFQPTEAPDSDGADLMGMAPLLCRLLALSKSLKSINVGQLPKELQSGMKLPMASLIPPTVLPRLQTLELNDVEASSAEIVQLMTRYAHNLIDVQFNYFTVTDADWDEVVTQLRAIDFQKLKYLTVDSVSCCEPTEVHDYVLRKTDSNPFVNTAMGIEVEEESS